MYAHSALAGAWHRRDICRRCTRKLPAKAPGAAAAVAARPIIVAVFILLALASAAFYGAADFIGGLISRRADTVAVVVLSQGAGLAAVGLLIPLVQTASPSPADWMWGGIAGLAGGGGVALLYRALAIGTMAVVAPITAVCAVIVPVVAALALGERLGVQAGAGILVALLAIVLVSQQDATGEGGSPARRRGIGLAFASGVLIGLFFLALARTDHAAGLWPLVAARIVSLTLFGGMILLSQRSLRMAPATWATAMAGGVIDMLANLLYLFASRQGPLTLAVTLSSLYPASTVILARFVLGERLARTQWVGVASALAAIVLIVSA